MKRKPMYEDKHKQEIVEDMQTLFVQRWSTAKEINRTGEKLSKSVSDSGDYGDLLIKDLGKVTVMDMICGDDIAMNGIVRYAEYIQEQTALRERIENLEDGLAHTESRIQRELFLFVNEMNKEIASEGKKAVHFISALVDNRIDADELDELEEDHKALYVNREVVCQHKTTPENPHQCKLCGTQFPIIEE
jgi:hypothetical protein